MGNHRHHHHLLEVQFLCAVLLLHLLLLKRRLLKLLSHLVQLLLQRRQLTVSSLKNLGVLQLLLQFLHLRAQADIDLLQLVVLDPQPFRLGRDGKWLLSRKSNYHDFFCFFLFGLLIEHGEKSEVV